MRNYTVLYSDKTFRLRAESTSEHTTTLHLNDGTHDFGSVQIIFSHPPEKSERYKKSLTAAVEAFNTTWKYFLESAQYIEEEEVSPVVEIRIV